MRTIQRAVLYRPRGSSVSMPPMDCAGLLTIPIFLAPRFIGVRRGAFLLTGVKIGMGRYFAIGIFHSKTPTNVGTLWRSASTFKAAFIFTIGRRYKHQSSDTTNAPANIPLFHYESFEDFNEHRPSDCELIGVEQSPISVPLGGFRHPNRAIYLLGAEDGGLPMTVQQKCQRVIHMATPMCLNVAVAGSIVMYDRQERC